MVIVSGPNCGRTAKPSKLSSRQSQLWHFQVHSNTTRFCGFCFNTALPLMKIARLRVTLRHATYQSFGCEERLDADRGLGAELATSTSCDFRRTSRLPQRLQVQDSQMASLRANCTPISLAGSGTDRELALAVKHYCNQFDRDVPCFEKCAAGPSSWDFQ